MNKAMFEEALSSLNGLSGGIKKLQNLVELDNFKYLTRVERDVVYETVLTNMASLEDTVKAMIKAARNERRARLRDDDQLSRMVVALSAMGQKVANFETPSETAQLYADSTPAPGSEGSQYIGKTLADLPQEG